MQAIGATISLAPNLSNVEREIIQSRASETVRNINPFHIAADLMDVISQAYFDCRYSVPNKDELLLMAEAMAKDVVIYFATITINEIKLAFHNGARGMYGEFAGLSIATFFKWLIAYMQSEERRLAIKKQNEFLLPPPKELTPEEKEKLVQEGVFKTWQYFKEYGICCDAGNVTYNYLEKAKVVNFTKERKIEIYNKVKEELIQENKFKAAEQKISAIKREIQREISLIEADNSDVLRAECKRKALSIFFSELKETGTELTDLL